LNLLLLLTRSSGGELHHVGGDAAKLSGLDRINRVVGEVEIPIGLAAVMISVRHCITVKNLRLPAENGAILYSIFPRSCCANVGKLTLPGTFSETQAS
jgi:hypothetical protein